MSPSNVETIFEHLNARRTHDLTLIESQLDPDVVHQGVLPELVCNNRNQVLHNIRNSFARDGLGVDHLEIVDAGERVVVGLAGPRFRELEGTPVQGQLFIVFTLREGRIVRMDDYLEREQALAVAGAANGNWV